MLNPALVFIVAVFVTAFFDAKAVATGLSDIPDTALRQCIEKAMTKQEVVDAKELVDLKCHGKGVESLVGLEQFSSLESLSLFGNRLSSVNLTGLRNLKMLNLASNKLTRLEITNLGKLHSLYVFRNQLTVLDLTGLDSLRKFRAMQNKLTVLNIKPLKALEEAYFWDNKLKDLEISGLDKLVFLDVKQNPMPDELYDSYDEQIGITIIHDGNADDWK